MPKAIKKRIPKKIDTPEEEVQEKLSSLKDTLQQRRSIALKIMIGVIIVVFTVTGFLFYSYSSASRAKKLESEAYRIYYGEGPHQSQDRAEQYRKALEMFKKAYDTKKSPVSLFYIAACYDELGQPEESLKTLQDFARRYSNDERLLPLVYRKMATMYLKKGDSAELRRALDTLYGLKGDIYKDFVLIEYGRLLENQGKPDEARKKYEELVTRFPTSPFRDEAQMKLAAKKEG